MNWLDLRLWLAGLLAVALLWGGWERMRGNDARTALSEYRLTAERARADAEAKQREIEAQRTRDVQEAATHAQTQINALERDLADSRRSADGLRSAAAIASRRACPRPAAASTSEDQPDPMAVFIDVLSAVGDRAAVYAEAADRARIAGLACERAYDKIAEKAGR